MDAPSGAITVEGSLGIRRGTWHGKHFDPSLDWEDRPTFTVRKDLRAADLQEKTLGAWIGERGATMLNALAQAEALAVIERVKRDVNEVLDQTARNLQLDPNPSDAEVEEAIERFIGESVRD